MTNLRLKESLVSNLLEEDLEALNELLENVEKNTNIHKKTNKTFFQILEEYKEKLSPYIYNYLKDREIEIKSLTSSSQVKEWFEKNVFMK
jgi:anion-transporting  ArsA/GET3 family ATPase